MEHFSDQGIVLSARPHGEGGAIVALLTEANGRHAGYVHGAQSSKKRGMLEPGSAVKVDWRARAENSLGTYALEPEKGLPAGVLDDPLKLGAMMSACSLCDAALPEREGHPGLFYGLQAMIGMLEGDHWGEAYIFWEIALLKELGFGLDLKRCAGGGDPNELAYVSPKTGRAVSRAVAAPYKERLLEMPAFLKPGGGEEGVEDIIKGLRLTGYFLEHWVFIHHTKGLPEARTRLQERFENRADGGK